MSGGRGGKGGCGGWGWVLRLRCACACACACARASEGLHDGCNEIEGAATGNEDGIVLQQA